MIDARELRIGNWVGLNLKYHTDNYFQIMEVASEAMKCKQVPNLYYFNEFDIEGIPLTEDILKRLGLNARTMRLMALIRMIFSLWNPKGESEFTLNDTLFCPKVEYVHHLQNLYWCLFGTELDIKL
jgi:hypothetical protein